MNESVRRRRRWLRDVQTYYQEKLALHGPSAQGVDWRDAPSQRLRFAQLVRLFGRPPFRLNDIGCGYGALSAYFRSAGLRGVDYAGYDFSLPAITMAKGLQKKNSKTSFHRVRRLESVRRAEYSVASGVFNVKLTAPAKAWERYVLDALAILDRRSTAGFAFNLLTSYSDPERRRPHLYYADPRFYFDYCKKHFSRNVALLHDYDLYEFTILVRKAGLAHST